MKKRAMAVLTVIILTALCACTREKDLTQSDNTIKNGSISNPGNETEKEETDAGEAAEAAMRTYDDVPEPVFSAESGCYADDFTLYINVPEGCRCYYSLDGGNPLNDGEGQLYDEAAGIPIYDRAGEPNVVNAVSTALYDAANVKVNASRDGYITTSKKPGDDAIDKCTVVRAAVVDKSRKASEIITATYFIGDMGSHIPGLAASTEAAKAAGFSGPMVISIAAEFDDFFDYERGIYVKGRLYDEAIKELLASKSRLDSDTSRRIAANYNQKGKAWERAVHIDFFETDGSNIAPVISQNCGIRIQGNYSRSDLQKGFRLYARSEYGDNNFRYPVFGDEVKNAEGKTLEKYKSLILRNGGNCAFTTKWSADYWAYLANGLDCESMASRPAIVYLNGEYWGLYVLEENYSADYFADKRGVDKESVVLYKGDAESLELGYKLDIGELPEGVSNESFYFDSLLEFFENHRDLRSDEDYEAFCKIADPDSVRDYFAVETWINNKWDWPGKNWSMWRVVPSENTEGAAQATADPRAANKYADGRWRFCFYDMEFGGVSGEGDATVNTVKEDNYKQYGLLDKNTDNPAVLCFAYCMTNDGFRKSYYDRLNQLSKVIFMRTRAQTVLNSFCDIYAPLYDQFFKAFPGTGSKKNSISGGYASKQCISQFLDKRYSNIDRMIEWCEAAIGQIH